MVRSLDFLPVLPEGYRWKITCAFKTYYTLRLQERKFGLFWRTIEDSSILFWYHRNEETAIIETAKDVLRDFNARSYRQAWVNAKSQ